MLPRHQPDQVSVAIVNFSVLICLNLDPETSEVLTGLACQSSIFNPVAVLLPPRHPRCLISKLSPCGIFFTACPKSSDVLAMRTPSQLRLKMRATLSHTFSNLLVSRWFWCSSAVFPHHARVNQFHDLLDGDKVSDFSMKLMDIDSDHLGIPVSKISFNKSICNSWAHVAFCLPGYHLQLCGEDAFCRIPEDLPRSESDWGFCHHLLHERGCTVFS